MAHPDTLFAPLLPQTDLGFALSLTPSERSSAVEAFFRANPGPGRDAPGLGRAIRDFLEWQFRSGRIASAGGSPWWCAVNGVMVLDLLAAMAGSGKPAPLAWRIYGACAGDAQPTLWQAHQVSLHTGIRRSQGLLEHEPAPERAFANIVIDVVDRTALAGRPTESGELAALVERLYPIQYPIRADAVAPLERMRRKTADALRGADGCAFEDVGLASARWRVS
jgi:hypothetical protein